MQYKLSALNDCKNKYLNLLEMFDRAGVPPELGWRSLLLFFREVKDYNTLSDTQKMAVQHLMANILAQKDYSDKQLEFALSEHHDIVITPYKKQVEALIQEAAGAVEGFQRMLSARYGEINNLEEESIAIITDSEDTASSILKLRKAFQRVKTLIEDDIRNLENIAFIDGTTKITNRRGFDQFMKTAIKKWLDEERPLFLAMLDIDHFKLFNDNHGHRIGDQVLTVVGSHMEKALRVFDENDEVLAARYGGEEFAMVVSGPNASRLPLITKKCCEMIEKFNFLIRDANGNVVESGLHITLSAGISSVNKQWRGAHFENIVDNADRALYHAKKSGRNAFFEFRHDEKDPFVRVTEE